MSTLRLSTGAASKTRTHTVTPRRPN